MAVVQGLLVFVGFLGVHSLKAPPRLVLQDVTAGIIGNDVAESFAQKFDSNNMSSRDPREEGLRIRTMGRSGTESNSQLLSDPNPIDLSGSRLAHIFVLTTDCPLAKKRMARLTSAYKGGFTEVQGFDSAKYQDTDGMFRAAENLVHITPDIMKKQWSENPNQRNNSLRHVELGALACRLGHQQIWKSAQTMLKGLPEDDFALILENDAVPSPRVATMKGLAKYIDQIPKEAGIAFLGQRHCKGMQRGITHNVPAAYGRWGSAAYAITRNMAGKLLALPVTDHTDYAINEPVDAGEVTAFCADPEFTADDHDGSTMFA